MNTHSIYYTPIKTHFAYQSGQLNANAFQHSQNVNDASCWLYFWICHYFDTILQTLQSKIVFFRWGFIFVFKLSFTLRSYFLTWLFVVLFLGVIILLLTYAAMGSILFMTLEGEEDMGKTVETAVAASKPRTDLVNADIRSR